MADSRPKQSPWRLVGMVLFIIAVIVVTLYFVDLESAARQLRTADWRFLAAASVMLVAGLVVYAARWRLLLGNKPGLLFTFHASNMGHAGNILIPFRGGEVIRVVVMGRGGAVTMTEATSSFVVERMFEQIMRILALATAVFVGVGLRLSFGTVAGGLGVVALIFGVIAWLVTHREATLRRGPALLARLPRVTAEQAHESLANLLENLSVIAQPRAFLLVVLYSLVTWGFFAAFFYLTLLALAAGFPPEQRLAVSLGALALSPPSAPTQPGIFHASVVAPLAAVGYDADLLFAYAVLLHALEMVWMIGLAVWGIVATGASVRGLLARTAEADS